MSSSNANQLMAIFFGGPPGSGKGTVSKLIEKHMKGIVAVSSGDICREEIRKDSAIGRAIKERVEDGVIRIEFDVWGEALMKKVEKMTADPNLKGFILDGCPRWRSQCEDLTKAGLVPSAFIYLTLSEQKCIERLCSRVIDPETGSIYNLQSAPPPTKQIRQRCTVRKDDEYEKSVKRVQASMKLSADADQWYSSEKSHFVDASGSIDEVFQAVKEIFESLGFEQVESSNSKL
mmetsp:Transcript_20945/g.31175  ORF Transcript_20945/g.31175 Transcript_20945/m.31175 type:complete len:233 (-) Transcript_20945:1619-2317(-)